MALPARSVSGHGRFGGCPTVTEGDGDEVVNCGGDGVLRSAGRGGVALSGPKCRAVGPRCPSETPGVVQAAQFAVKAQQQAMKADGKGEKIALVTILSASTKLWQDRTTDSRFG